ncbi:MAG: NfeD family protein [Lachnospiraceae bacterium]|nr:NfeD family protein [Lachnospiraceae bacterium]
MVPIYWLIALVVLVLIDIFTMSIVFIWFGIGALVALIASLLGAPIYLQFVLFGVVSVILLIFTRPIAVSIFNKNREKTNVDSLIGKEVRVVTAIDKHMDTGAVRINGIEWSARTNDGHKVSEGETVKVLRVEGVKVIVE